MNGSHRDLIHAFGRNLLLHHLGRHLFGGGVGDLGGRCRSDGQGMWDVEGGGGWGSGVDYLPG